MSSQKTVILVDPLASGAILKSIAKSMGYTVFAVYTLNIEKHLDAYGLREVVAQDTDRYYFSSKVDQFLSSPDLAPGEICAVIAAAESGVLFADELAWKLGLRCNDYALSQARRDKFEMRKAVSARGLRCPRFQKCTSQADLDAFMRDSSFPVVIKTPMGAGANLVFVCHNFAELVDGFKQITSSRNLFGLTSDYAVIEEYINGEELVVNLFGDGQEFHATDLWTYDKINLGNRRNLYYNAIQKNGEEAYWEKAIAYAVEVARSVGIKLGPAHVELRMHEGEPVLMEVGGRLPGAGFPELCRLGSNFDTSAATIEVFVKGQVDVPKPVVFSHAVGVAFCPIESGGTVSRIKGLEEIKRLPSYRGHELLAAPGAKVKATVDLPTTPLQVHLGHPKPAQMRSDMNATHELFGLEFAEEHLRDGS